MEIVEVVDIITLFYMLPKEKWASIYYTKRCIMYQSSCVTNMVLNRYYDKISIFRSLRI